jgi:hypothetical protein
MYGRCNMLRNSFGGAAAYAWCLTLSAAPALHMFILVHQFCLPEMIVHKHMNDAMYCPFWHSQQMVQQTHSHVSFCRFGSSTRNSLGRLTAGCSMAMWWLQLVQQH